MSSEDFLKKIGFWLGVIGAIFLFLQKLSPSSIGDQKIDLVLSIIRASGVELIAILVIGLLMWKITLVKKVLSKYFLFRYPWFKWSFIVLMVLMLAINFNALYNIAKYRYKHYSNFENFYKHDLYASVCENINSGNYTNAVKNFNSLAKEYRDEDYKFDYLEKLIVNRIEYASKFSLNPQPYKKNGDAEVKFSREKFISFQTAYLYHPSPENKIQLESHANVIRQLTDSARAFHKNLQSGNREETLRMFDSFGWFLFEDNIYNMILDKRDRFSYLQYLAGHMSESHFVQYLLNTWQWEIVAKLFNWQRQLKLAE